MEWDPTASKEPLMLAVPPLSVSVPSAAVPSLKVTVPVGVPPLAVTLAVKVTSSPNVEGFRPDESETEVNNALWVVFSSTPILTRVVRTKSGLPSPFKSATAPGPGAIYDMSVA
jgi:hypothetical protein